MKKKWLYIPIGFAAGFANGLFGSGGGTIIIPALEKFLNIKAHKAHATAVAVILPLTVLSALIYIWGIDVDWKTVLWVSAGGVIGGLTGAKLLNKLSSKWLHFIFAFFMLAAAVRMVFA